MKKLIASFLAIYSALLMTGCGKDNGGGGNNTANTCAAGQVWNGASCVYGTDVNGGSFRFGVSNCTNYSCGNTSGFTVTNTGVYQDFIEKGLGVCSTVRTSGATDCKNWWPGGFEIVIQGTYNQGNPCMTTGQATPTSMSVYIKASYVQQNFFDYGAQFMSPYYPYRNGATYTGSASNIAQCNGFEVRTVYGLYTLQLQVLKGNLKDGSIPYILSWGSKDYPQGTEFARGVLYRY